VIISLNEQAFSEVQLLFILVLTTDSSKQKPKHSVCKSVIYISPAVVFWFQLVSLTSQTDNIENENAKRCFYDIIVKKWTPNYKTSTFIRNKHSDIF